MFFFKELLYWHKSVALKVQAVKHSTRTSEMLCLYIYWGCFALRGLMCDGVEYCKVCKFENTEIAF